MCGCVDPLAQVRVPVIIVGPPGSTKTLSFQIVRESVLVEAMVRPGMFFEGFAPIEGGVFHYQCSEFSTSADVKTVFENAIQRQRTWPSNLAHQGRLSRAACVFLDEAGLPERGTRESLKVRLPTRRATGSCVYTFHDVYRVYVVCMFVCLYVCMFE
jgi:hypothetical protein